MRIFTLFCCIIFCSPIFAFTIPENICNDFITAIHPAIVWHKLICPNLYNQTQEMNILDIDLSNPEIKIIPLKADGNQLETVPNIANKNPFVIAGINGGYFYNAGDNNQYHDPICPTKKFPQPGDLSDSLLQINGKLIAANCDKNADGKSHLARSVLAITAKGEMYFQQVSPNQALKNLNDFKQPRIAYAIGGGPNLVSTGIDGKGFINITDEGFYHTYIKAPRTAVGITHDNHLLLLTVDGKSEGSGMRLNELADFMLNDLQVSAAINLDGGGSTTMCIKPTSAGSCIIVNKPSDESGPRKVYDGLFVLRHE